MYSKVEQVINNFWDYGKMHTICNPVTQLMNLPTEFGRGAENNQRGAADVAVGKR